MTRLKFVFYVNDADGKEVIDRQQSWIELNVDDLLKPTELEHSIRISEAYKAGGDGAALLAEPVPKPTQSDESLEALGLIVQRFLGVKLREWARAMETPNG